MGSADAKRTGHVWFSCVKHAKIIIFASMNGINEKIDTNNVFFVPQCQSCFLSS